MKSGKYALMLGANEFSAELKKSLNHPLLSEDEIRKYLVCAKEGDEEAIVMLLTHNERLVFDVCRRYFFSGATGDSGIEDLMQEGRMGLLKAIHKFDLERTYNGKPVKFITYATYWIRQHVSRHGIRDGMTIAVSYSGIEKRGRAIRARIELTEKLNREPTTDEISAQAKVTNSISSTLDFRITKLEDTILDGQNFPQEIENRHVCQIVVGEIQKLPPAQRDILTRSLLYDETVQEISQATGKSVDNVRKARRNAIQKIRLTLSVLNS